MQAKRIGGEIRPTRSSLGALATAASAPIVGLGLALALAGGLTTVSSPALAGCAAAPAIQSAALVPLDNVASAGQVGVFGCEGGNIGIKWLVTHEGPGLFHYKLSIADQGFSGNPFGGDMTRLDIPLLLGRSDVFNVTVPDGWSFNFDNAFPGWDFAAGGDTGKVRFEKPVEILAIIPADPLHVIGDVSFDSEFAPTLGPYRVVAADLAGGALELFADPPIPNSIPEPGTLSVIGAGVLGIGLLRRSRKRD